MIMVWMKIPSVDLRSQYANVVAHELVSLLKWF